MCEPRLKSYGWAIQPETVNHNSYNSLQSTAQSKASCILDVIIMLVALAVECRVENVSFALAFFRKNILPQIACLKNAHKRQIARVFCILAHFQSRAFLWLKKLLFKPTHFGVFFKTENAPDKKTLI